LLNVPLKELRSVFGFEGTVKFGSGVIVRTFFMLQRGSMTEN
jgi:hypothetical protein